MKKVQLFKDRHEDLLGKPKGDSYQATGATSKGGTLGLPLSYRLSTQGTVGTITQSPLQSQPMGTAKLPIKQLSPAEIQQKIEKGLCFSCDEKYHLNDKCRNWVLLMCDKDEDNGDFEESSSKKDHTSKEEEIEIILHALSNSVNLQFFCIMARHGIEDLEVLIDTGSNNNFIQHALVEKLGLGYEETKRFKVYMGNDHYLVCDRMCKRVELTMQGHQFMVDFYVLPNY